MMKICEIYNITVLALNNDDNNDNNNIVNIIARTTNI